MNFRNLLFFLLILFCSCEQRDITKNAQKIVNKESFVTKGFTLIYNDTLFKNNIVDKKMDGRSYLIFQKNLKKNSIVKIKNISNNKSIIAKVSKNAKYPLFNNSVISDRIAKDIELDISEPYVEIHEILNNSSFIANKAKTYEEEKNVADKAPIQNISINNLNENDNKPLSSLKNKNKKKFSYNIKIADFYFKDSASTMIKKIKKKSAIKNIKVDNLSKNQYRVFLGPFNNINSLQKAFNDITILEFENIEIIKND